MRPYNVQLVVVMCMLSVFFPLLTALDLGYEITIDSLLKVGMLDEN